MIVPSIDLQGGQAVQLVNGETLAIEAGDPTPIAQKFGMVGPIAVIDLDAAMGAGENRAIVRRLCQTHRCRVGGGIRDVDAAIEWLDAGAEHIIIGTAAEPKFLQQLPKDRLIVALDVRHERVVVDGWRRSTNHTVEAQMERLRPYVDGFLVTFVEQEGMMNGTRMDRIDALVAASGDCHLTIAGGVTTADEVRALDQKGVDCQVGMALYSGRLTLAEAVGAPMISDRPDGLWPTIVVDEFDRALGLCYSNQQSLTAALETQRGVYWSRSRGLWEKGATSGATQELLAVALDCDRDALLFRVRQHGPGFCHLGTCSCFGELGGLATLSRRIEERMQCAPSGSYTHRLLTDDALLASKVVEEAHELVEAAEPAAVAAEAADLIYFTMVTLARHGVALSEVSAVLDRRSRTVTRRPGDAKPQGANR